MMEEFYLRFPAKTKYLHLATAMCRELCTGLHGKDVDKALARDVEICVSEACTNAIQYGSRREAGDQISVCFRIQPDRVTIRIEDKGEGFNLSEIPVPNLNNLPESGYGLYIIQAKMDDVRYVRDKEGNFLEMTKFFTKPTTKRRKT